MPQCLRAIARIFWSPYWSRIWVVQELTVAEEVVIYCGDDYVPGTIIIGAQDILRKVDNLNLLAEYLRENPDHRNILLYNGVSEMQTWRKDWLASYFSLYQCVLYHAHRFATDPRDMVYGLIGLLSEKHSRDLEVNYSRNLRDTTKRLEIITRVTRCTTSDLPSWVPDFPTDKWFKRNHVYFRHITSTEIQLQCCWYK